MEQDSGAVLRDTLLLSAQQWLCKFVISIRIEASRILCVKFAVAVARQYNSSKDVRVLARASRAIYS